MKIKTKLLKLIKNCVNFSLEDGERLKLIKNCVRLKLIKNDIVEEIMCNLWERDKNDIVEEVMCNLWESGDVEVLYEKELFDECGEINLRKDEELFDLVKVKVEELVNGKSI